ncbi:MAG: ATPase/protein kinase family protein [Myxococcaceae bacterium]|nr:ATPase/protein kinase family protein [Myxococcaceae bacterium]
MMQTGLGAHEGGKQELLFDRFGALEELGSGGFGTVVRAFDFVTGHEVALKLLHRGDPDGTERFKKEFRSLVELEHPNLVRLGELFERDKRWAFSMELVPGEGFLEWVAAPNTPAGFDEPRLRAAVSQLATALEALHGMGLIHRDIKPANLRVDHDGRLVLLDFGLVTQLAQGAQSTAQHLVGTIQYMAPEQTESRPSSAAVDMYAFGVLLYEALTQRLPFEGDLRQIMLAKYAQRPLPPREWNEHVPPDLEQLCLDLLALRPEDRPSATAVLSRLGGPVAVERSSLQRSQEDLFVGRETELAALFLSFEQCQRRGPQLLLIEGESGIGKSTLIAEFVRQLRARESGVQVLCGRCHAFEHVTYKAFDEIVDQLARVLRARSQSATPLRDSSALLPALFPALHRVPSLASLVRPRARAERTELFDAFRDLIASLCEDTPVVLTVDDLQWSDPESVALLKDLLDFGELRRLLLIASCRPVEADERALLEPLLTHASTRALSLRALPEGDAQALLTALWGGRVDEQQSHAVLGESRGHPLFLTELARQRGDAGTRTRSTGATLDESIMERVSLLDERVRRVLEHVCLSASPLPHGLLANALGTPIGQVYRALTALRTARLVRSVRGGEVLAYHDRVREALSLSLAATPARRSAIHRALADAWMRTSQPVPARIAHHLLEAGDEVSAAPWLERAAERALETAAFERAAELFGQRLTLSSAALEPAAQKRLLRAQADALAQAGRCSDSARVLGQILQTARGEERRDLLVRSAQQLLQAGEVARGLSVARTVMKEMDLHWSDSQLSALLRLGWHRLFSIATFRGAPSSHRGSALDELKLDTMSRLLQPLFWADLLRTAEMAARYARLAWRSGSPAHIARALGAASVFSAMQNPDDCNMALSDQAAVWAERDGTPAVCAYQALTRGGSLVFTARFREAAEWFERADELYTKCQGEAWMELNTRGPYLGSMFLAGEHRQFKQRAAEWMREAQGRGDAFASAQLTLVGRGASRFLIDDEPERAVAEVELVLRPWRVSSFGLHHYYEADVLHHAMTYADPEQAYFWWTTDRPELRVLARRLRGFVPDMLDVYRAEATLRFALHGRRHKLLAALAKTAIRLERASTPRARARATLLRAQVLAFQGGHAPARAAARQVAAQLGRYGEFRAQAGELLTAALTSNEERDQCEQRVLGWLAQAGWKNPARALAWMLPVYPFLRR